MAMQTSSSQLLTECQPKTVLNSSQERLNPSTKLSLSVLLLVLLPQAITLESMPISTLSLTCRLLLRTQSIITKNWWLPLLFTTRLLNISLWRLSTKKNSTRSCLTGQHPSLMSSVSTPKWFSTKFSSTSNIILSQDTSLTHFTTTTTLLSSDQAWVLTSIQANTLSD